MQENQIETKSITELLGLNFYIPAYQRGYRWTKNNVLQLLNDIWEYRQESDNRNSFYCLQPIVVRKKEWPDIDGKTISGYELVDGQQRLTTIHRILTCILLERYNKIDLTSRGYKQNIFSIYYETRLESKTFLETSDYNKSKPDLYYMSEALECIKAWFYNNERGIPDDVMDEVRRLLLPFIKEDEKQKGINPEWSVQVIWYEINDEQQKSEDLFTRLNRGKIPLTSAELIKAKFVNADSFKELAQDEKIKRRTQLIQIWDEIENQLNNPKFWGFISNYPLEKYSNKIEYLFDVITQKKPTEKDLLYSFINFFEDTETEATLWAKWIQVEDIYRSLLFWFSDRVLYHKIGYLITTGTSVRFLSDKRKESTKDNFELVIDKLIAESIHLSWEKLNYEKSSHHQDIIKVLLLTNVELMLTNDLGNDLFPFGYFKSIAKSLEHIHSQNIDKINQNSKTEWGPWLNAHINILPQVATDKVKAEKLIREIRSLDINNRSYKYDDFKKHSSQILELIPTEDVNESEYLHNIENLALLGLSENISLSNSVFEVKRRKLIEMDRIGSFIPQATKRIFLKYYSLGNEQPYSIWTKQEREAYLLDIRKCVEKYKPLTDSSNED
ncbi:DUF262 domain-containing protein [Pedobacter helvus]|uniref:DUF262 domain-containing protein n=1 Tax=Pedobacter helvus TaxID=2563444 RepID=A0ABW9JJB0_9SPHI|nr:DUF262 domain-containing protein [Pedobacter ureilyticus]